MLGLPGPKTLLVFGGVLLACSGLSYCKGQSDEEAEWKIAIGEQKVEADAKLLAETNKVRDLEKANAKLKGDADALYLRMTKENNDAKAETARVRAGLDAAVRSLLVAEGCGGGGDDPGSASGGDAGSGKDVDSAATRLAGAMERLVEGSERILEQGVEAVRVAAACKAAWPQGGTGGH